MTSTYGNSPDCASQVEAIIGAIFASPTILIRVVQHLLEDLRAERRILRDGADMEIDEGDAEGGSASAELLIDSRPVTPDDDHIAVPVTLLEIISQSQSPGAKRKRSITHIGSIAIASIVASSQASSIGPDKLAGRAVIVRRRVGLGRLFSGMGMGREGQGMGGGNEESEEESESEDDDLIVII